MRPEGEGMDLLQRTEAHLARLIGFPTVSSDPNLDMIAHLAGVLESAGAVVELQHDAGGTKANLLARIGPDAEEGPAVVGA